MAAGFRVVLNCQWRELLIESSLDARDLGSWHSIDAVIPTAAAVTRRAPRHREPARAVLSVKAACSQRAAAAAVSASLCELNGGGAFRNTRIHLSCREGRRDRWLPVLYTLAATTLAHLRLYVVT